MSNTRSFWKRFYNFFFPGIATSIHPINSTYNLPATNRDGLSYIHPLDSYQKVAVVRQCVSLISRQVSTIPLKFQKLSNKGDYPKWENAVNHPHYELITGKPNPFMTNIDFRGALLLQFLLWGNAYVRLYWDLRTGYIKELWPLRSDSVVKKWDSDKQEFYYQVPFVNVHGIADKTKHENLEHWEIMHIKNLSAFGWLGISPITAAIQDIEGDIVARNYQIRNLEKAIPAAVLSMVEEKSEESYQKEIEQWNKDNQGLNNLGIVALGPSQQFNAVSIPEGDKAWLETKELVTRDITALYHVPLHKINRMDQSTFGNVAAENKDFVDTCLNNVSTIFDQSYMDSFLLPKEYNSGRFRIFHDYSAYLKADPRERAEIARIYVMSGIYNRNEIREQDGNHGFDGGEIHTVQVNMADINNLPEPSEEDMNDQIDNNFDS